MISSRRPRPLLWIGTAIVAISFAVAVGAALDSDDATPGSTVATADPGAVYNPVSAGEELPRSYRPLLDRDQIAPVYRPTFAPGDDVDWPLDTLVIGVAEGGTAKAYPVTHLNSREMVIDSLEGIPILVTW